MSDYVMMSDILYVTAVRGTVPKSEVEIEMAEEDLQFLLGVM